MFVPNLSAFLGEFTKVSRVESDSNVHDSGFNEGLSNNNDIKHSGFESGVRVDKSSEVVGEGLAEVQEGSQFSIMGLESKFFSNFNGSFFELNASQVECLDVIE